MSADARSRLTKARRIVVKLGTQVVARDDGRFALGRLSSLMEDVADLRREGRQVILVSSGAIGLGATALGLESRPTALGMRQACAAVGQGQLMALYARAFGVLGTSVAQVLLTAEDLADPDRALCLRTTLLRLVELGVVPVLNENDSVSVREIVQRRDGDPSADHFGDNDGLAARVAAHLDADLLLLLTDVDGLFTANPKHDPAARRIPVLEQVDDEALARAQGRSTGGTGGMASKLDAARLAAEAGTDVVIGPGRRHGIVAEALAGADVGTLIPGQTRRPERRRRIALRSDVAGGLIVNPGAARAIRGHKASLLPVGVVEVDGSFGVGALVEVRDEDGRVLARGLTNYDSEACRKLRGLQSEAIEGALGWRGYDALIGRDNMAIVEVGDGGD